MAPRLDKELHARGMAPSRSRAAQLITSGAVQVAGEVVTKPSTPVQPGETITLTGEDQWVSRAAHKLLSALETFGVDVMGLRCLDAGASTGGFTQVLLTRGAEHVVAVDVGHDQLHPSLRADPRVTSVEGVNLRYTGPGDFGAAFDLVVADLSFISLRLVIEALTDQTRPGGQLLLMVKPQFEVGREHLGRTGVITDPELRRAAVEGVMEAADSAGLEFHGLARSGLAGQDGNLEFFLHLRRGTPHMSEGNSTVAAGTSPEPVETPEGRSRLRDSLEEFDFSTPPND
ncbi:TlyA family RNA methyltransferase [Nesterenkonia alba]|uniref:TlyA family RNA methyltransferase n=1 Tax=Nesterenkonia alba TaxID=515814 RepID=UPI0003B59FB2|nr:TlyA family RNA methyltransferase [Nesterenkonia alba]